MFQGEFAGSAEASGKWDFSSRPSCHPVPSIRLFLGRNALSGVFFKGWIGWFAIAAPDTTSVSLLGSVRNSEVIARAGRICQERLMCCLRFWLDAALAPPKRAKFAFPPWSLRHSNTAMHALGDIWTYCHKSICRQKKSSNFGGWFRAVRRLRWGHWEGGRGGDGGFGVVGIFQAESRRERAWWKRYCWT
jgi:hypothetical protein